MTTDDERAQKIAEAKARAEAARAARAGGAPASTPAAATPPAAEPEVTDPSEPTDAFVVTPAPAAAQAAPAGEGLDDRARKIAEAKARAEAARAGRAGGAAAPAAASPAAEAPPAAAAASAGPPSADERQRRIEEAKARAAAARAASGAAPAASAAAPAAAPPAAAAPASPAAARPAAAASGAPAAEAPRAVAPAGEWRGPAAVGSRVVTARPDPGAVGRREVAASRDLQRMMTRRSLVRSSFWAGLGVTVAGLLLGFVNFFWPRGVQGFGGIINVPAAQVPEPGGEPIRNIEGKFWLVNLEPGGGVPAAFQNFAAASTEGGLLAIYQKCPHLGCAVPWRPEFEYEGERGWFRCPCHGSTYTKAGIRVFGPAPRPMDLFPVTVSGDGSVSVNTDPAGIITGSAQNPQRAVLA